MSEKFDINSIPEPEDINDVIYSLMVNPNLSPLNYFNDITVGEPTPDKNENELVDFGISELEDNDFDVAMSTHAFSHHFENDPKKATEILVSRAARKMICYGAEPKTMNALLYHINYTDPKGQEMTVGVNNGLKDVAEKYGIKLTDCKIRYDNFEGHGQQLPAIIISMLGHINKVRGKVKTITPSLKKKGNNIWVIGRVSEDIGSSEYLEFYHGVKTSPLPEFDIEFEKRLHDVMYELISENLIESASPVGKGGLFFSLLRAGWKNGLGFDITTAAEAREDAFLFGEGMGRIMVSVDPDIEDEFVDILVDKKIPFFTLGHVTKGEIRIDDVSFGYINKMSQKI